MSPTGDNSLKERRSHDAEASRAALLTAAREVFVELGYERATTRRIGERAGVDPALISRYFESKAGLFLAAIASMDAGENQIADYAPRAFVAFMLEYWDERGHSPLSRALASPVLSEEIRGQVQAIVERMLLAGETEALRERDVAQPRLRAELLVACAVGIAMTRANGTLESLAAAPREEILASLAPVIDAFGSS